MAKRTAMMKKLIKRCQKSPMFFIENFCQVKHPAAGIIPFRLFKYQTMSIFSFLKYRFNIYRKTRQCFVKGTIIWTPSGPKSIETIQKGDEVYSLINGRLQVTKAQQVHSNGRSVRELYEVRTKTGHRSVCTHDHKFLTNRGWVSAEDLSLNDVLIEFGKTPTTKGFIFNRVKGQIKSIKQLNVVEDLYDLSVPPADNYIVDGAVVHNCGISTLAGVFALWYGMFFRQKTILIVSKRDLDAKAFLDKNVKFVYNHLPDEFKEVYGNPPPTYNEHSIVFPNGSSINSLTSSKDTLRSNSSSLNIIDESAFMPDMDSMWAAGMPTLQHGGSVIVISTTNGIGNWYQVTWEGAEKKENDFNPIIVNWWDMDWTISYKDELSGEKKHISPTKGLRKCETKEEINKWGEYYSPWLQDQYRQLQQRGEAHLFRQEILAEFIGTGQTVLSREALVHIGNNLSDTFWTIAEAPYVHPVTEEQLVLDFEHELRIWQKPVRPEPDVVENGRIIKPGDPGHTYSMGVDISSGEADDYSAIVIVDCTTMQQAAELNIRVLPAVLLLMIDYLARWYNGAFVVPERQGLGLPVCQSLYHDIAYTNVYRMKSPAGKTTKKVGFPTNPTYKPQLNKCLMDHIGEDGIQLHSRRLYEQLLIYVHLGGNRTGAVEGPGNHDDLSIALALALVGVKEAVQADQTALIPKQQDGAPPENDPLTIRNNTAKMQDLISMGGVKAMMPMIMGPTVDAQRLTPEQEMFEFTKSLGGIMAGSKMANPVFKGYPMPKKG